MARPSGRGRQAVPKTLAMQDSQEVNEWRSCWGLPRWAEGSGITTFVRAQSVVGMKGPDRNGERVCARHLRRDISFMMMLTFVVSCDFRQQ